MRMQELIHVYDRECYFRISYYESWHYVWMFHQSQKFLDRYLSPILCSALRAPFLYCPCSSCRNFVFQTFWFTPLVEMWETMVKQILNSKQHVAIDIKVSTVINTLSMDVMGLFLLSLIFSRSLKYCSTVLFPLLLLAIAVATAALMLSIEIAVILLRCISVALNSLVDPNPQWLSLV